MCGIFGVLNLQNSNPISESSVWDAIDAIEHRGPDAGGVYAPNASLALGHRRLSIIDIHPDSNQPFSYENLTLTFNGEIFNYIELKSQLSTLGYSFRTASDTEVVAAAYLHWGSECVLQFNGMWSFVIYDHRDDSLFCSRDRFGIKPFNYSFLNGRFVFASEIKAMHAFDERSYKIPNYNAISRFCRETVGAQAKETWFEGVFRLPPAHNMLVTRTDYSIWKYWHYPSHEKEELKISFEEAQRQYDQLFQDSVKLRLRSDVPLGITLSGGLDSASIACEVGAQTNTILNTYTASFPNESFDEYPIAKRLTNLLGMKSVEVQLDYSNYTDTLSKIIYHLESAHGSPAIFPLWNITKRAKDDITVFLEGQGADEALGGYINSIFIDHTIDLLKQGKWKRALAELGDHKDTWPLKGSLLLYFRQNLGPAWRKLYRMNNGLESLYQGDLVAHNPYDLKPESDIKDQLTKRLTIQHQSGLVNLLHYGDAISMAHSLENRLPFLDYRLVEFIFKLPSAYKVEGALGKIIHRRALANKVPSFITENREKLGFVSPLKHVFSDSKYGALDVLLDDSTPISSSFNRTKLEALVKEHQSGKKNHERILFKVLGTKLWSNHYMA